MTSTTETDSNPNSALDLKSHRAKPKADQSRVMRDRLVAAALKVLLDYGYQGVNLKLVAETAGVSRGPLHYHFRNKHELLGEVARVVPTKVSPETRERIASARTVRERLLTIVDIAAEQHHGEHHLVILELLIAARTETKLAEKVIPHLFESEHAVDDWWAEYFIESKLSRPDEDALRTLIVSFARGLAVDRLAKQDPERRRRAIELFREMVSHWIDTRTS